MTYIVPERIFDGPVVEGVQSDLDDDVGKGDDEEGEQEQDDGVDEGVQSECEQSDQDAT